jgi:DNA-binding PadR family transcriptional regulator
MLISSDLTDASKSGSKLLKSIHEKVVKNFMDAIIMLELRTNALSGYDAINLIHAKYGLLVSSGTVYSMFYSLERNGLIKGAYNDKKRVYKLTEKGEKALKVVLGAHEQIKLLIDSILKT